jgi:small subunit ribosomal protein S4e
MTHLRRENAPKRWPIKRKGSAYVVKMDSNGLPVLIALRDVLKIANKRSEIKKAIHKKEILICGKIVNNEKKSIKLLDTLTINPLNKNYRMILTKQGKFNFQEIKENEKDYKIEKIINKKILKGKKIQLNLSDGRNFLSDMKCNVNDSVLINLKNNKIEKCLPMKEGAKVLIISGKHIGEQAVIKKIENKLKMVDIESHQKNARVLIKQIMVIE